MARGSRLRAWSGSGLVAALMPGGGIRVQHLPARALITIAYQLQPYQLVNAPGWASETFYDVEAKPAGAAPREQTFAMLQALLVERFRFAFHRESRQLDGFALVRVRLDRLGPDLLPCDIDCEKAAATTPRCRTGGITTDTITAVGTPVWSLLQLAIAKVGAPGPVGAKLERRRVMTEVVIVDRLERATPD